MPRGPEVARPACSSFIVIIREKKKGGNQKFKYENRFDIKRKKFVHFSFDIKMLRLSILY